MKTVLLPNGMMLIVDDADFAAISKFKWHTSPSMHTMYAKRHAKDQTGKRIRVYIHRQLLEAKPGFYVDHIDGNGLNNQRSNLRLCTPSENSQHIMIKPSHGFHSKYIGVSYSIRMKKWSARATVRRKTTNIGWLDTESEAAAARDEFVKVAYGQFAHLNKASK